LSLPVSASRARIESDQDRRRVAGADVDRVRCRVDRRRHVDGATTTALRHPLRARLGDGVEGPDFLARLRVVGGELAADPVLGAGDADVDLAVVGGRGHRLVRPGGRVFDLRGPEALAGLLADRLQLVVEGEEEELAVFGGDAAVDGDPVAADPGRLGEVDFRRVGPVDVAGLAVDRHHLVGRGGDVDGAVQDQREGLHQVLVGAEPGAPRFAEFIDVGGIDFVLGGEAGVVAVAAEERPVFGFRRRGGVGAVAGAARTAGGGAAAAAGGEDDRRGQHREGRQEELERPRHRYGVGLVE
jgi:hypothetical protein